MRWLCMLMPAMAWHCVALAETSRPVSLRREYNQVVATIDTLIKLHQADDFQRFDRLRGKDGLLPSGYDLVLLFWADDEAELYLNSFKVGQTRLTPTLIEIPEIYLQDHNILEAHCWDTDRVESGFMAGLFLRDQSGRLRRVLVTGNGSWRAGEKPAQQIYYNHAQPDIPGAHVIWAEQLFGEVWLAVDFAPQLLSRALSRPPRAVGNGFETESMEMHDLAARLAALDERKRKLAQSLVDLQPPTQLSVAYRGHVDSPLAFTLGKAAPLMERESIEELESVQRLVERLPAEKRLQIIRRGRNLKGSAAATASSALDRPATTPADREDRRRDYTPPPERGGILADTGGGSAMVGGVREAGRRPFRWTLSMAVVVMGSYLGLGGRQWWRLYSAEEWAR